MQGERRTLGLCAKLKPVGLRRYEFTNGYGVKKYGIGLVRNEAYAIN